MKWRTRAQRWLAVVPKVIILMLMIINICCLVTSRLVLATSMEMDNVLKRWMDSLQAT